MKPRRDACLTMIVVVLGAGAEALAQTPSTGDCTSLGRQQLPNTTVSVAEVVAEGSFTPAGSSNTITALPPFCRVAGVIAPTNDSQIRFEVWLPTEGWNGKFAGVGNGGWAGVISYGPLADQLRRGYAAASTNTGHEFDGGTNAARFAYEKPELLIDFAYRSHHETAVAAKALVERFYGRRPARAYFIGCSSGGYEGLMEAQRFPADYDGIVAGAPANNWTRLMAADFEATLATFAGGVNNLPPSALGLMHRAVLARCDGLDGVTDGVLEDPRECRFDPASLTCREGQDAATCLAPSQVEAARRVYEGVKDPATGARLYPGLARGSEPFWPNRDPARPFPIPIAYYKWLVFGDPQWDWTTFSFVDPADYDAHRKAEAKLAPILNATSPDLAAFQARGGKLLQWHGWNDQLISAENSIDYYESVLAVHGAPQDRSRALTTVQGFYRLFLAPGMTHCSGGPGPNTFDMQIALERWVEHGTAPDRILATHAINAVVDRLRPLCPYPQVAAYLGSGDTNDATNFACRAK